VPERELDLLWRIFEIALAFGVVLGISIWLVVRIKSRYWGHEDPAAVEHEMLAQLGDLHREGQLTEEEYRSIKGRLLERIGGSVRGPNQTGLTTPETPSDHFARKPPGK
jgi:hypothetical protein